MCEIGQRGLIPRHTLGDIGGDSQRTVGEVDGAEILASVESGGACLLAIGLLHGGIELGAGLLQPIDGGVQVVVIGFDIMISILLTRSLALIISSEMSCMAFPFYLIRATFALRKTASYCCFASSSNLRNGKF